MQATACTPIVRWFFRGDCGGVDAVDDFHVLYGGKLGRGPEIALLWTILLPMAGSPFSTDMLLFSRDRWSRVTYHKFWFSRGFYRMSIAITVPQI